MNTRAPFDPREMLPALSWITPVLAMGRRPETYVGFDLAVSCEWHLARKPMEGYEGLTLHVPMRDEDDFELDANLIARAAHLIDLTVRFDGKVLVHCTGGLNRSGVVVAETLKLGLGIDGKQAVWIIRKKRDEYALCNRAFERWVTGEDIAAAIRERYGIEA